MSIIRSCLQNLLNFNKNTLQRVIVPSANFSGTAFLKQQEVEAQVEAALTGGLKKIGLRQQNPEFFDRSQVIEPDVSIRYLKSAAYKTTYGKEPVWKPYRRNFKGQYQPSKTRKTCIRQKQLATSWPCPICRDIYLVLDYRNVELLKQFVSPYNGEILNWQVTGLCQRQHQNLLVALHKAHDYGTLAFHIPFRTYDYRLWYPNYEGDEETEEDLK